MAKQEVGPYVFIFNWSAEKEGDVENDCYMTAAPYYEYFNSLPCVADKSKVQP